MRIHFDEMPENARLWVYQANKPFDDQQEAVIREKLEAFLDQWAAHGAELTTAYEILYQRFVFIAVDEKSVPPSGCSIDASVRVFKELNELLEIDFLDRSLITYKTEDGIGELNIPDFREMLKNHSNPEELIVFNNLIGKKSEMLNWEVKAKDSWHKQWLP